MLLSYPQEKLLKRISDRGFKFVDNIPTPAYENRPVFHVKCKTDPKKILRTYIFYKEEHLNLLYLTKHIGQYKVTFVYDKDGLFTSYISKKETEEKIKMFKNFSIQEMISYLLLRDINT